MKEKNTYDPFFRGELTTHNLLTEIALLNEKLFKQEQDHIITKRALKYACRVLLCKDSKKTINAAREHFLRLATPVMRRACDN